MHCPSKVSASKVLSRNPSLQPNGQAWAVTLTRKYTASLHTPTWKSLRLSAQALASPNKASLKHSNAKQFQCAAVLLLHELQHPCCSARHSKSCLRAHLCRQAASEQAGL